ncbi:fibronectin type III domain-containing protein [Patescibacteria group bacterium]|nr:fibronectin type III domain-containing protein [Patescibacteria group bacterium]
MQKNLEELLKEAKSVDSKSLVVDREFKESLREWLYNNYLNQVSERRSIMAKLKIITLSWKVIFLSVAVLIFFAGVAGGGIFLLMNKDKGADDGGDKMVLLAADLAVADGGVEIKKSGDDRWMEAVQGDKLEQGDSVRTGSESRAVIIIDNGDAVRLNNESEVNLENLDPSTVVISQVSGESYSRVATSDTNTYTIKGQGVEARALGTAYVFNSDEEKQEVKVYVYESDVKVSLSETDQEVAELKKAFVDIEKGEVKVEDMKENEYKDDFAKWNRVKDAEEGYTAPDIDGPKVDIAAPKDGATTIEDSISVKGTVTDEDVLRKIVVNGKIYDSKNPKGKGFDPLDGTFDVDVSLVSGKNTIKVTAYDAYWNAGKTVSVTVTRESEDMTPEPTPDKYFYVDSVSSPAAGKIYVKWVMAGYSSPSGFKAVAAIGSMPVYPGSKYVYMNSESAREATFTNLPAGTYNLRVCIYNGSGECVMYTSNYKTVSVEGSSDSDYPTGINISVTNPVSDGSGNYKVTVSWSTVGGAAPNGFKVCYAEHSNPSYPSDTCYLKSSNESSHSITGLVSGKTYYFRVGIYKIEGGGCKLYSDNKSVTVS